MAIEPGRLSRLELTGGEAGAAKEGAQRNSRRSRERIVVLRSILLIGCPSRFAVLERRLFVDGHAFFSHRQDHRDADIGSGDRRQIDYLLFAEKFLGAIEQLV